MRATKSELIRESLSPSTRVPGQPRWAPKRVPKTLGQELETIVRPILVKRG